MTATRARLSALSDIVRQAYGIAARDLLPLQAGYRNALSRAGGDEQVEAVYRRHNDRAPAKLGG